MTTTLGIFLIYTDGIMDDRAAYHVNRTSRKQDYLSPRSPANEINSTVVKSIVIVAHS